MKRQITLAAAVALVVAAASAFAPAAQARPKPASPPPPPAPAADYVFTQVGQNVSPFTSYCPKLNDHGEIAVANQDGIFFGTPGDLQQVVSNDELGVPAVFGTLLLNDAGDIAFALAHDIGELAIFHDGQVETIATADDPDLGVAATSINDLGQVAYLETLNTSYDQGLFLWEDGVSTPVLLPGSGPVTAGGGAALNDAGQLAFKGPGPGGLHHVYLYEDGVYTEVPVPAGVNVSQFNLAGLTEDGAVLLSGWRNGRNGLFALTGGALTTVVDSTGFDYLHTVATNDVGGVVVAAAYDNWTASGIFDGPSATADKVVAKGDGLFGSTVFSVTLCGLNDAGQITFTGSLANGSGFLAVASRP